MAFGRSLASSANRCVDALLHGALDPNRRPFPSAHPQPGYKSWPIPDELRAPLMQRMAEIACSPHSSNREVIGAMRVILCADAQNQADEQYVPPPEPEEKKQKRLNAEERGARVQRVADRLNTPIISLDDDPQSDVETQGESE